MRRVLGRVSTPPARRGAPGTHAGGVVVVGSTSSAAVLLRLASARTVRTSLARGVWRHALVASVALVALLAGCEPAGDGGSPANTAGPTSEVTPVEEPSTPPVEPTWPTDCKSLGAPGTRAEYFDDDRAQPVEAEAPAFPGATLKLQCSWHAGDVSGLSVVIAAGTPADVTAAVDALADDGYTCRDDRGGRLCTKSEETEAQIDVGFSVMIEITDIVFARDGVWVNTSTSNIPDGLPAFMNEIVADMYR